MKPDEFMAATKPVLKMAAIDFTKAAFETKYMEKMYSDSDFDKLESGVEKICEELKSKVFGEAPSIEKEQWVR